MILFLFFNHLHSFVNEAPLLVMLLYLQLQVAQSAAGLDQT